jgi:hypothetical protein
MKLPREGAVRQAPPLGHLGDFGDLGDLGDLGHLGRADILRRFKGKVG